MNLKHLPLGAGLAALALAASMTVPAGAAPRWAWQVPGISRRNRYLTTWTGWRLGEG